LAARAGYRSGGVSGQYAAALSPCRRDDAGAHDARGDASATSELSAGFLTMTREASRSAQRIVVATGAWPMKLVAQLVNGATPSIDAKPYACARFD
jgi:hypothetical protein